jgi:hypothetical protein
MRIAPGSGSAGGAETRISIANSGTEVRKIEKPFAF